MKKRVINIVFVAAVFWEILLGLTACGEKKEESNKLTKNNEFSIKYSGVEIAPGNKFDESKISEEATLSEIPSCAFDGVDKVYTYPNVELIVADIDGTPTVYSVYFIDDTVSTEEGVKLSDEKSLMLEKYGEGYKNSLSNKYDYTKGNVELSFIVENDIITGIEYTLITNN